MTAVSFIIFLLLIAGIGVYSATRKQTTAEDYLLASRSVSPWLTALSGVATNNSGFMFLGLIGMTLKGGISASWIMLGWVIGDWLAWFVVHERLRRKSEEQGANTIPGFLAHGLPNGRLISSFAGLIILVFLGLYAAAQFRAGSKALHFVFGWDMTVGVVIGAVLVVAYCFAGGIRASIWTDAAQSMVMLVTIGLLVAVGMKEIGGFSELWENLHAQDPTLVDWTPTSFSYGFAGYFLGWVGAGAGVVGQPHIMVRAMAIDSPGHVKRARRIYVTWFLLFSAACTLVGLLARALLANKFGFGSETGSTLDVELALPLLSSTYLPGILVGLTLAGILAATISTADSQILACSAAVTQDIGKARTSSYFAIKLATLGVAALALAFALLGTRNIFELVVFSWSALAAGLGSLMVIRSLSWPITTPLALAVMAAGLAGSLGWYFYGDTAAIAEVLPGLLVAFFVYLLGLPLAKQGRKA